MKSSILAFILTICVQICYGQSLAQQNETILFSFTTKNKKEVAIFKTSSDNKVFYRFGTKTKPEFQFPPPKSNPSQKLTYSFYLRGGGINNEGMELNYIYFVNDNFQYIIYDTYFSAGNKQNIGVRVVDLKTKKITDIPGDIKTIKGTLTDFRDNQLLGIGDEIFD